MYSNSIRRVLEYQQEDAMSYRLHSMKITGVVAMLILLLVMGGCLESGSQPENSGFEIIDLHDGNGTGDGNPALTIGFGARDYRGPDAYVQWETLELLIEGVSLYTGADYTYQTPYRSGTAPLNVNLLADAPKAIWLKPQPDTDYSALTLDLPKNQCEFTARGHINGDTAVEITVDLGGLVAFIPRGERFRWSAGEDTFIGVLLDAAQLLDAGLASQLSADSSGTIRISEADNPQMYHKMVERIIRAFSIYNDPNHDGAIDESEQDEGETADSDPFKIKCEFPEKDCTAPDGSFPDRMCINNDIYECSIVRDTRGCPIAETYNSLVESCETDTCTRGENQNRAAYCDSAGSDGDMDMDFDDVEEDGEPIVAPRISVTPEFLDMGVVTPGTSKDVEVNICNTGNTLLSVLYIDWLRTDSSEWTFNTEYELPEVVRRDHCIAVNVRYTPTDTSCNSNSLFITSNDLQNRVATLPVSAGCPQADGDVDISDMEYADEEESVDEEESADEEERADEEETETTIGPVIEMSTANIFLGFTQPGTNISSSFQICNTGDELLSVPSLGFEEGTSSEWELQPEQPYTGEIAADTCATINVSYTPQEEICQNLSTTKIMISSNDPIRPTKWILIRASCTPFNSADATPGLYLTATTPGCSAMEQVDLIYKSPNGISCSEQTMNSMHTCNFGDYGAPVILQYATQCQDGISESIWHPNPPDGEYMVCVKMTEDCTQWGFNLFGEEICLSKTDPDVHVKLRGHLSNEATFLSTTVRLNDQGDMRCWSLERINGEYPSLPQPLF